MELDRLLGDPQKLRHLLVRRAARSEPENLELALGQAVRVTAVVPDRPERCERKLTAVVNAPVARPNDRAQRVDEIRRLDGLAHEAHGAGRERGVDDGLVIGARNDHDPHSRVEGSKPPDARDAAHAGHAQVEQHRVGLLVVDQLEQLVAGGGARQYVDPGLAERQLESREEEWMIVGQNDSRHKVTPFLQSVFGFVELPDAGEHAFLPRDSG